MKIITWPMQTTKHGIGQRDLVRNCIFLYSIFFPGLILLPQAAGGAEVAIPGCPGGAVEITDFTFTKEDTASCDASVGIRIGPDVTLRAGANLSLSAPWVIYRAPFSIENNAQFSDSWSGGTGRLNDTGIDWGGTYPEGNNATCTSNGSIAAPQDCDHGRDATRNGDSDGEAGFSFTKLDADGKALSASATSWNCVHDNVTALTWEVKTDDAGIHDKDNTYRWGGKTALGSGYGSYYDDWDTLVDGSNAEALCGFTDWRVPTIVELLNLADLDGHNPAIDTRYFPNTAVSASQAWWSSSPRTSHSSYAKAFDFGDGSFYFGYAENKSRSTGRAVRLVRP